MKNITKNAKAILFASLIVAMILPFSGMDFAVAQEKSNAEVVKEEARQMALSKS